MARLGRGYAVPAVISRRPVQQSDYSFQSLTVNGSVTATGTATNRPQLVIAYATLSGSITAAGVLAFFTSKPFAGVITAAGALRKLVAVAVGNGNILAAGAVLAAARLRVRLRVHGKPMLKWLFGPPQE